MLRQQAWSRQMSPEKRRILPTPLASASALNGSATMNPPIYLAANAATMSEGGITVSRPCPACGFFSTTAKPA